MVSGASPKKNPIGIEPRSSINGIIEVMKIVIWGGKFGIRFKSFTLMFFNVAIFVLP